MPESLKYTANTRLPTRPLSYEFIDQAMNKELIADYNTGEMYLKDANGVVHNITTKIAEALGEEIHKDPTIITEAITITIVNPDSGEEEEVAIDKVVAEHVTKIENITYVTEQHTTVIKSLQENDTKQDEKLSELDKTLNDLNDGLTPRVEQLEEEVVAIGKIIEVDESGKAHLPANNIVLDKDHQFVTQEQLINIESITSKAGISYKKVTIRSTAWQGSEKPYTVTIPIAEVTEDMRPTMDLICSAYYDTSEKEEDAFQIYRGVTANGSITLYNRVKPEIDLTIQFEFKNPFIILDDSEVGTT